MGGIGSGRKLDDADWEPAPGTVAWGRQPKDTAKAWDAFCLYRNLGPRRTFASVAATLGKKPSYAQLLGQWSSQFHWVKRCIAYDSHTDDVSLEAMMDVHREDAKSMVLRHTNIAAMMQRLATVELMRTLHHAGVDLDNPDLTAEPKYNPKEIQALLDQATKLERLNRNQPEAIIETRGGLTAESLEERIAQLISLRESEE